MRLLYMSKEEMILSNSGDVSGSDQKIDSSSVRLIGISVKELLAELNRSVLRKRFLSQN